MINKTILITGGSSGIGKNLTLKAIEKYKNVLFTFNNNKKKALILKKNLKKKNFNVKCFKLDLSSYDSILKFCKLIKKEKIFIDILINNAATSQIKNVEKIKGEDWDYVLNTNLKGPFFLSQKLIGNMKKKRWGRIVNISSIGGQWGGKDQVHYAISKSGMIGMTRSFAKVYSKFNITTNTVSPGLVETSMSKKEIMSKQGKKKIDNIPIGRIANMNEITSSILFLCSQESSYITGQTLNLNGGMLFN